MDIHELLNKLKASCKSPLASDSENAAVAAIEEHLANSVPLVSKEPDGYSRLGCGSLVKFDEYVYATDGTRFKIPNRDKILVRDDSGEVTYSRNLADLFAAPPKSVTPVESLRQIVAKYDDGTLLLHECIDAAREVLARETGGTP